MGKPFAGELRLIESTIQWANQIDLKNLSNYLVKMDSPIYVVGSGGSLSACHFAVSLLNEHGKFARAVTPLELFYLGKTISKSSLLFITASGKNYDINFAFKQALEYEPKNIGVITMNEKSPLSLLSRKYGISSSFDYNIPSGKDGFLATNTLIAFYIILKNALEFSTFEWENYDQKVELKTKTFIDQIDQDCAITVLHGGWSKSIALDIESKCTEAGLTPTLISDFRNFGHGRHHWFSKRSNSAIIALTNSADAPICSKTLKILPKAIPKLILKSDFDGPNSAIDVLIKSFVFISKLGQNVNIDPGKPGVPEYGRKLYHLPYSKLIAKSRSIKLSKRAELSIKRKIGIDDLNLLDISEFKVWKKSYDDFMNNLLKTSFGMIMLDYDGTICSSSERYSGPSEEMTNQLLQILENGFMVGIVSGRGQSVRTDFQRVLPKKYWEEVLIGYYNGSDYGSLTNDRLPDKEQDIHPNLKAIIPLLLDITKLYGIKITERPKQITIEIEDNNRWSFIRNLLIQTIKTSDVSKIQILESSHSMDIIPDSISKLDIIPFAKEKLKERGLSTKILSIGDKGQWSGNDFMLLDSEYGLSVDEVSSKLNKCWNIASLGNRNLSATLEYLNCLEFKDSAIYFKINK